MTVNITFACVFYALLRAPLTKDQFDYPYSQDAPCRKCVEAASWEELVASRRATCEALFCLYEVPREHLLRCKFDESSPALLGSWPLLVGWSGGAERQVLASPRRSELQHNVLTLDHEGAVLAVHDVPTFLHGEEVPDGNGGDGCEEPINILVLAWDPHEAMQSAVEARYGLDATGPFYWKTVVSTRTHFVKR